MKHKFHIKKPSYLATERTENLRLLLYALITGILVGIVCAIFRVTLGYIETFRNLLYANTSNDDFISWVWPILFTIVGISLSLFLVRKYAPEASGSGIQEIEGALGEIRPMRWKRIIPVKLIGSLFSLGSGLLLGREGPTIQLGANIGKMVKDVFRATDAENNPLISAGAAAGLASAFNAPFSGIIFVIEEMHKHFKFNFCSITSIMIGAGTADLVVRFLIDSKPVIQMQIFPSPNILGIWLFVLLGAILSVIGYFYNKSLIFLLDLFKTRSKTPIIYISIFVGLIISLIGIFSSDMIGGGYDTIIKILDQSFTLSFLLFLFVIRMALSLFSYGVGVPGGIFIPMLTLGIIVGMLFGIIMQPYFPNLIAYPGVFAVAGMAGIFSATVRAPLTGLVLAVEMTSNYELILPLIITTVTAAVLTTLYGNKPIYETLLNRILDTSEVKEKLSKEI